MERLVQENKNTPVEYDRIFQEREVKGVSSNDIRRWKKLLRQFKGGKLLDIGCLDSLAYDICKLRNIDCQYLGIDVAEKTIETLAARYRMDDSVRFEVRDAYDTKLPTNFFDYALMGELIEHLEDPEKAMVEAMRILKPKGVLAISTPHNEAREPGSCDGERHLWSFEIHDIVKMLKPYGRVKTSILGSEYFPVYRYHWPVIIAWCRKK